MRVVIEGIRGSDLVLLMKILEKLDFDNKHTLIAKWEEWLKEKGIKEV